MSQAQRSPLPDNEALQARTREQAEAEAAVGAVMTHVAAKAAEVVKKRERTGERPKPHKALILLGLTALNLHLWLANPEWLHFKAPPVPTYQYYQDGWKMAAYMQAQRVEEFRKAQAKLPARLEQVRNPVRGVDYRRVSDDRYELTAGTGRARVVYDSRVPLHVWVGKSLIRLGLLTHGVGR